MTFSANIFGAVSTKLPIGILLIYFNDNSKRKPNKKE